MGHDAPVALRCGPLDVYLKSLRGCPDLQPFLQGVPRGVPFIWYDSARQHPVTGRWSMAGYDPWLTLVAHGDRVELRTSAATHIRREHPLEALRSVLRRYHHASSRPQGSPRGGREMGRAVGLMGFLSYDLNRWIEPRLLSGPPQPVERPVPEMLWFGMRVAILVDHLEERSWLLSVVDPHVPRPPARREAMKALRDAEDRLIAASRTGGACEEPRLAAPSPWQPAGPGSGFTAAGTPTLEATESQAGFEAMVLRALDYIRAGDIFQANVSQRFTTTWEQPPFSLYLALRRINPSPFSCFLSSGDLAVVSSSPERLVRVQERWVESRPIAGTRPRGATPAEDLVNSLDLLLSEKERAEHLMLVDLMRNDLGRVSTVGSVRVNELMTLEEYSHVIHLVSDVSGLLRRGMDAVDVIRAVFPGGTITGCPKVRCMEILRELEGVARGLYTGSLGYLAFDGTMDLNIVIRTMVIQGRRCSFHVGAGIVADSDPEREYHETLAKAGALMGALHEAAEPQLHSHGSAR
ncbi:MAG: anthranilate synthase component I family protein [Candidatus Omnitrophica bacterium]|nr:anthranilate synthase component I family protein [Candidatus Omnitrophota bacterium]